jgi:hypothetical protein
VRLLHCEKLANLRTVKQGGVTILIMFCVCVDDLLVRLHCYDFRCFIGLNYVGTIAGGIVLVTPTVCLALTLLSPTYIYIYVYNAFAL